MVYIMLFFRVKKSEVKLLFMGVKAKNPPMLPSEIDRMNEELIVGNHLYSRDIDGSEKMREVIRNATKGLDRQPISLADSAAVQVTAEACIIGTTSLDGIFPV